MENIIKLGNKNYIIFDWEGYITSASLGDPTCFREIAKKLREVKDVDGIIIKKSYRKILEDDSFKILKEYVNVIKTLPEFPSLCDKDFEEYSLFKFRAEESPVEAINHLKEIKSCEKDKPFFDELKKKFSKTKLWNLCERYKDKEPAEIYHLIFKDRIIPAFITYHLEKISENAKIIERYEIEGTEITIVKSKDKPYPTYYIKPRELKLSRKKLLILNQAFEKLSEEEFEPEKSDAICEKVIDEVGEELSNEEKKELTKILKRYSFGFGIIEVLLKDSKIQDVYVDSPGDKPIYVYHEDYEECDTNIILTPEELEKLSTRFRMLSGRPFDESYPILHAEIKELNTRVAGVTEPLTFSGIGFAFRKHATHPWTLQQFIKNKMLTPEAAGLISFLVDGQQSMLITGPRGSGKTSLLSAILAEVPQNFRIITIEDTPELPIEKLRDLGYNIQHLRVKSTLQREGYEVSAEEALRNALRLGESVLVIGEVRGEEARSLFEAMRIGAAGNVVLGTIHGSSAYDVWDRIVNDLKVPSTSFKATNYIISCAPIRKGEELKRHRRVIGLTEVLKYWKEDPHLEKGFLNVMNYNRKRDKLEFTEQLKKSPALKEIALKRGMTMKEVINSIKTRAKIKELIVKTSEKNPNLLNVKFAVASVNKFLDLTKTNGKSKPDYRKVLSEFKDWLKEQEKSFR